MSRIKSHGPLLAVSMIALALGAGLGVSLATDGGSSRVTVTRTATRTIAQLRTVQRFRIKVQRVPITPKPAPPPVPGARTPTTAAPQHAGPGQVKFYAGSGPTSLGTITITSQATLRWTNSAGRFQILFNGGVAGVDSAARSGETLVPPQTYRDVKVNTPGRWTIRIG